MMGVIDSGRPDSRFRVASKRPLEIPTLFCTGEHLGKNHVLRRHKLKGPS